MKAKRHSFFRTLGQSLLTGAFFAMSAVAQGAGKVEDWIKLLPETAVVVISIKDTPEFVKDWDSSGAGRFMEDEAVKRWMAPMYEDNETPWDKFFNEMTGTSLRDTLALYPGASVAGIILESTEDFEPGSDTRHVAISDITGNEAKLAEAKTKQVEAYKKDEYPDAVLKTKEIDGVQVSYIIDGDEEDDWWVEAWAVVNGLLVEASDEELITDMIARVKAAQGQHPAAAHFARLAEMRGGEADITIYGHLDPIFSMMKKRFEEESGGKPSPITPQGVFDALGVAELHAVAACIELNDQHARGDVVLFHDEKPQGIFPALVRGTSTDVPQLAFIPADVDAASVNRASLGNIYDSLFKSLTKLGPVAALLTGQLDGLEKQAGISIRNDLLGSLDDVYLEVSKISPNTEGVVPEQNQVTAFKLKNRDRFQSSFNALWKMVGNGFGVFEETDYEGYKIFTMKPSLSGGAKQAGVPSPRFGYVITDEYVFLVQGAPDLLHKVLGRLKNSPAGTSLWDQPQSQTALAALPKDYTAMGVSNGSSILRTLLTTMARAQSMVPMNKVEKKSPKKGPKSKPGAAEDEVEEVSEDADKAMFDPNAAPPDEIFERYFGVGATGVYPLTDATQIIYISQPAEKK